MDGLSGLLKAQFGGMVAFPTKAPAIPYVLIPGPIAPGPQAYWSLSLKAPLDSNWAPYIPQGSGPTPNLLAQLLFPKEGEIQGLSASCA